ncbi:MAG: hypothetical protein K9G46_04090 [Flavobacteriales bacterium]|jgi:hypothetical protein|nr:hypothetical protein [Flavobacteriales bacterium]
MTTRTLTIETENSHALRVLEELAELKLIRIRKDSSDKTGKKKLSELLLGSISKEEGERMQEDVRKMRDEWERDF